LIIVVKEKGYNRCFAEGEIGITDRKMLSILRQKIPLAIVFFLLSRPYSKFKEISDNIDVLPTSIAYHLKKLLNADIVEYEIVEVHKRYLIKDSKYVIQLLIKYKPQSLIDDYEEMWKGFSWSKDLFKKF
jgi:predicted transcriptional regulator